jgi:flagellar basal-body rod protein FlgG
MIPGVYRAAAAMLRSLIQQDIHAHNLANANTPGFRACLSQVVPARGGQSVVGGSVDMRPGDIRPTGNSLDVALRTGGFFVLDTGAGRRFTRNGRFGISADRYLVSAEGFRVLGTRAPIRLNGTQVEIAQDGTVHCDGKVVDRLLVVEFPAQTQLSHGPATAIIGNRAPTQVAAVSLEPGALEDSNVIPTLELTAMTAGFRVYEANAGTVSQLDRSLERLIAATTG